MDLLEVRGAEAKAYLDAIAHLRMQVFQEFPYLYDGDLEYEKQYLETYFSCEESYLVICSEGSQVIGVTTSIPLKYEDQAFKKPFFDRGYHVDQFMYFGESILLSEYRGRGIGRTFFEYRERNARKMGYGNNCFCAVVRPDDHPMRPKQYRPHDDMWKRYGYHPVDGLIAQFSWKDLGLEAETKKELQFWLK